MLTYGPNGVSRGIATIIFSKPGHANNAFTQLNGLLVDQRPIKVHQSPSYSTSSFRKGKLTDFQIEIVVDASKPVVAAGKKGLADRIAYVYFARRSRPSVTYTY